SAACEPAERCARDQLWAVTLHVAAPVRQVRHLAAQAAQRERELHAIGLDRAADLRRGARRHQRPPSAIVSRWGVPAGAAAEPAAAPPARPLTRSRVLGAPSIPLFGPGGAARLTAPAAIRRARPPRARRSGAHAR